MTTEDDFQAALDAHPSDWQTRLVFADWLEERRDPRAEGYRALGTVRKQAVFLDAPSFRNQWIFGTVKTTDQLRSYGKCMLADPWFKGIASGDKTPIWKYFLTRREAEDAAARAFAKLPAGRRAKIVEGKLE